MKATTLFSSWENAQDVSRANLLFENRNKSYGGYFIRVYYPERIFRAFLFAVFGFGIFVGGLLWATRNLNTEVVIIPPNFATPVFTPPTAPPTTHPHVGPPIIGSKGIKPFQGFTIPVATDSTSETDTTISQLQTSNNSDGSMATNGDTALDGDNGSKNIQDDKGEPTRFAEVAPMFPGGDPKLFEFLQKNIIYPVRARENNTQGYVYLTFVVDRQGKIRDVKLLRGIGDGCEEEAIRVVEKMPDWTPGRMGGERVAVQYNLPVNFKLK